MKTRQWTMVGAALAGALILGACREEEQGRVVRFEKGTYAGPTDTPLGEETLRELQQRARYQNP